MYRTEITIPPDNRTTHIKFITIEGKVYPVTICPPGPEERMIEPIFTGAERKQANIPYHDPEAGSMFEYVDTKQDNR